LFLWLLLRLLTTYPYAHPVTYADPYAHSYAYPHTYA
jgi:hypothetical protein